MSDDARPRSGAPDGVAGLRTRAPAKINLTLEVLGPPADGYHALTSIAQTLDLADAVEIRASAERVVRFVDEEGRALPSPATGEGEPELVDLAWRRLVERFALDDRATVTVTKRIPLAGGLGGGSSDAAAFLRLARRWWDLPAGQSTATESTAAAGDPLWEVAAAIGSDVALFLVGGTVRLEGRGERVSALEPLGPEAEAWSAILYTPEIPLPARKTATMYRSLRSSNFSNGGRTRALAAKLERGEGLSAGDLHNAFDPVADEVLLGVKAARRRLATATQRVPMLAGAGPSLFVLDAAGPLAEAVARLNATGGGRARLVRPLSRAVALRVDVVPGGGA